ncbi:MAG TPA: hypothetical protein DIC34_09330 [Treponema sp.]|nr:MAG: hypothetical protein A2001_02115 [Treponema sp. GWC1_61_84]HCM26729.1 hypothetical protein [Treponema sp.]
MYEKILVCLDGSEASLAGGRVALHLAREPGTRLFATHIYDSRLHSDRFREMEPVLPERYQKEAVIAQLRDAHEQLIEEGFSALSFGYLDNFLREAKGSGIEVTQMHRQGRNYVEIHRLVREIGPDLLILGASGLGRLADRMGSTTTRLLSLVECDVLIARADMDGGSRFLAGIDGSEEALAGMAKALAWAKSFKAELNLAAAYDPSFHAQVFGAMGRSLSPRRQEEVGLDKQQDLHDEIIDDGLGKLYAVFLEQAMDRCLALGGTAKAHLLQGKPYQALVDSAKTEGANLIVVGRFGHHREELVPIGSNSEAVSRLASANVLVASSPSGRGKARTAGGGGKTAGPAPTAPAPAAPAAPEDIEWEPAALEALNRVPSFARPMARSAVELVVRKKGGSVIDLATFRNTALSFGMKPGGDPGEGKRG